MKLLYKYTRLNLIASVLIFLLAAVAFYFALHYVLLKQVDEDLQTEKHELETAVHQFGKLPAIIPLSDEITTYTPVSEFIPGTTFSKVIHKEEDENEIFREFTFCIVAAGKNYRVSIAKSLESTEDITKSVILIATLSIFILLIAAFIINRIVLKRLWMPFYRSMQLMKDYRIGQKPYPVFPGTDITEFNTLNKTLSESISNSEHEYKNLKEFTENASHEMQTPVAVIRSKMDVLIQDEHLSESQSSIVQEVYDAVKKLASLNRGLLLLTRISNSQYSEKEKVQFDTLVKEKLQYFNEIIQNKSLKIEAAVQPAAVMMNALLADMLLNNLVSNSIRHSAPGGTIEIALTAECFTISNGFFDSSLDAGMIFKRFHKEGKSKDEHGLGLAIVEEICIASGFRIVYSFADNKHIFTVHFR